MNKGILVIDANLLVLLVVGSTSRDLIKKHKRLEEFACEDFDLLQIIISEFSEIVLLPHIMAEVSNLARQIREPARHQVQLTLKRLVMTCVEYPAQSRHGIAREEFLSLGLTDAIILHLCGMTIDGVSPTLLSADTPLADAAHALGFSVVDYRCNFLAR